MSDMPSAGPTLEERLGLVLRGVQRMADGLGAVEQRLPELASGDRLAALSDRVDQHRARSRAETAQVAEVVTAVGHALDVVLREQQQLNHAVAALHAGLTATLEDVRAALGAAPDRGLAERLAALEAAFEQLAQREDVRRGVDRVLGAVSSAEQAVAGEVRAVDARVGSLADDVRILRVLRDGLDALADGVDGVRQLAARTATSQQMSEVTRELGAVLAEIETARSQVLRVERSSTPVAADVVAVGGEVDDLGRRIDRLAEDMEERLTTAGKGEGDAVQQVAERLRRMSLVARQLGNGVLEDVRSRRGRVR